MGKGNRTRPPRTGITKMSWEGAVLVGWKGVVDERRTGTLGEGCRHSSDGCDVRAIYM